MKRILAMVVILCLLSSTAFAEGTRSGTAITALEASLTGSYDDGAGGASGSLDKNSIGDETTSVTSVFGLEFNAGSSTIDNGAITGGEGAALAALMIVTNKANAADVQLSRALGTAVLEQASGDTSLEAEWNTNTALNASFTTTLAEEADGAVTISVTIPAGVANGTTWSVPVEVETASTPVGQYTGFNSTSYGGLASIERTAVFKVAGTPDLQVQSRTHSVVSNGMVGYTGGASDAVPGAKIIYTIVIENVGNAAATNIVFSDAIPTNTSYLEGVAASADNGLTFTYSTAGPITWTQENPATTALPVGGRVTLNYTVAIN